MNVYCDCGARRPNTDPPICLRDGRPMRADPSEFPPLPAGWVRFDHTFTPEQAAAIIEDIPPYSYHWVDIERKRPGAVGEFTQIMREGRWKDQLVEHGFVDHPIRWDDDGITHGVMRLLACRDSGVPFRAAVEGPRRIGTILSTDT